jgi:hypothetical protein
MLLHLNIIVVLKDELDTGSTIITGFRIVDEHR